MSDFISLTCPTCGGALKAAPGQDTLTCAYCGNSHLIRQEGSAYKLEAFARCPVCKRNDQVQKISALIKQRPEMVQYFAPPAEPVPFTPTAPPQAPEAPKYSDPLQEKDTGCAKLVISTLVLAVVLVFAIAAVMTLTTGKSLQGIQGLIFIVAAILAAIIVWVVDSSRKSARFQERAAERRKSHEKDVAAYEKKLEVYKTGAANILELNERKLREYQAGVAAWQKARDRFNRLYYCQRDDVVFSPGDADATPLSHWRK